MDEEFIHKIWRWKMIPSSIQELKEIYKESI